MTAPEFADWWGITATIARYGRLADERRHADMADLFVPDGRMLLFRPRAQEPAESPQGRAELQRAFQALDRFVVTSHVLSPSLVEGDGADRARASTHCMAHHIEETSDGRVRFTLADRYEDTLVRIAGRWLFCERRKYTDWTETAPLRR
ncbi:MAG: nuclear transport factor 2 family protein [Actinobacteria bacterium]|nr:nuclear transport factor 2 family protein [Actinomycetota bacterium]